MISAIVCIDLEVNLCSLFQCAESGSLDFRIVYKQIRPASVVINPYPLSALNHFTLPVLILVPPYNVDKKHSHGIKKHICELYNEIITIPDM